jgi:hypothetical protein
MTEENVVGSKKVVKRDLNRVKLILEKFNLDAKELEKIISKDEYYEKIESFIAPWSHLYEFSFNTILVLMFEAVGLREELNQIIGSSPAPSEALNHFERLQEDFDVDSLPNLEAIDEEDARLVTFLFSLLFTHLHNIEAIKQRNRPISTMIQQIKTRVDGYEKIIFEAITIDRTVVSNPTIAKEITKAQLRHDESFMNSLSKAITRTKPARYKQPFDDLRFMMQALSEYVTKEHPSQHDLNDMAEALNFFEYTGQSEETLDKHRQKRRNAETQKRSNR